MFAGGAFIVAVVLFETWGVALDFTIGLIAAAGIVAVEGRPEVVQVGAGLFVLWVIALFSVLTTIGMCHPAGGVDMFDRDFFTRMFAASAIQSLVGRIIELGPEQLIPDLLIPAIIALHETGQ